MAENTASAPASFIDPTRRLGRSLPEKLRHGLYASKLYDWSLRGRHPVQFTSQPKDPWPGSLEEANAIFRGEYAFAGKVLRAPNRDPWVLEPPSQDWADAFHGFSWLRHFTAAGGDTAQQHAKTLLRNWLRHFNRWHPVAWAPQVLAQRLISWVRHASLIASTDDLVHHSDVMNSLGRQARHLARTAHTAPPGMPRLLALIGLVYSGFCLPDGERRLRKGLNALEKELEQNVLADGGIITRSPSDQLTAMKALVALRLALEHAHQGIPIFIQNAIDRMAPMLRFYQHGDGALALFHGSYEEPAADVAQTLELSGNHGKPIQRAIHSGYQRVEASESLLLIDVGDAPDGLLSRTAHASIGAFEFSSRGERLLVNCGSSEQVNAAGWQRICRATAAHTALVVNDTNNLGILPNQRIGRRPRDLSCAREESAEQTLIEVRHDGYGKPFSLTHQRRVGLSHDGLVLAGSDRLGGRPGQAWPFDIRFHLHPLVQVVGDMAGVTLTLPSGQRWQFHAQGAALMMDDSIYLGQRGTPVAAQQIVLSGTLEKPDQEVRWELRHIPTGRKT